MGKKKKTNEDSIELDLSEVKEKVNKAYSRASKVYKEKPKLINSVLILILLLVSMSFSYSVRDDSSSLEVTQLWAEQTINNAISQQASAAVRQQYPNLQGQEFNDRVSQVVSQIKQQNPNIQTQIDDQASFFKDRLQLDMPDGSKQTYLLAIDPWQYYRLTQNYLENGHPGDELVDGEPWNNHMLAPDGRPEQNNFHIRFSAFWHKVYSIFNPGAELLQSFFWVPVIISMLAVIPAFFLVYRRTNLFGGFIASLVVAIHPYFISRTAAGFSDTDAYNVFFPLLITWLVIEAFEAKDIKFKAIIGGLAGLAVGVFSYAWAGWWYIFDFMIVGILGYFYFIALEKKMKITSWDWKYKLLYFVVPFLGFILYFTKIIPQLSTLGALLLAVWVIYFLYDIIRFYLNKNYKEFRSKINESLISFSSFFVSSLVFVSLFKSLKYFISAFTQPLGFTTIQSATHASLWPNVYTTVAELNQANIGQIITNIGFGLNNAKLFFFIALLGIAFSFLKDKLTKNDWIILSSTVFFGLIILQNVNSSINNFIVLMSLPLIAGIYFSLNRGIDVKYAMIMTIWFIGTMYASTQGVRFILLMVPVFGVAVGLAFGKFYQIVDYYLRKEFEIPLVAKKALSLLLIILLLTFMIKPIGRAHDVGQSEIPSFDDAWWESLKTIESDSQPDAIINSWWDFGHWFKAVADRAVTFDGASQNTPQAHWIGRALSASSEEETIGILRMLDCGGNGAWNYLISEEFRSIEAITLIKEMILLDKNEALAIADEAGVSDVNKLLELTHCVPPENYFITSGDMVGKSGVWSHFGNWDFTKAYVYYNRNNAQAIANAPELLGISQAQVNELLYVAKGYTEEQANQWIGPFDGYVGGGSKISCTGEEKVVCSTQIQLNGDSRGINVLEEIRLDLNNYSSTQIQIGVYDYNTGQRLGGDSFSPKNLILADEEFKKYPTVNAGSGLDVIFDPDSNVAMISGPAVSDSTFTKLYFFDGKGTSNFEKLSDKTTVTGNRIIVWKVVWPEI